ncbi:protein transport protein SFT2, putative [Hepatocystis sp. ex Piliocolobus tephrosceles]|nr:protein transport protein SFT2, putative [Hepatocystis sp. ex Piliocolobus tephrosceles]
MANGNMYDGLSFFENNDFQNINKEYLRGSMEHNNNKNNNNNMNNGSSSNSNIFNNNEGEGLLQKAISLSKLGAENIQKGIKKTFEKTNLNTSPSVISNSTAADSGSMFSNFPLFNLQNAEQQTNSFVTLTTLLSYKNFPLFCLFFGISMCFLLLSFFTLPMIVISPRQFGSFFTLSSICFVISLAFLKGTSNLYYHLTEKKRLPFTTAYILSLIFTLYFSVINPMYLLALITTIVQVLALISFIASYIPGGANAIKLLITTMITYLRNLFQRNNSSDLPF